MSQGQAAQLIARGGGLHAQGKLRDALNLFNEAIAASPADAEAFAGRADVLTDLGDFARSLASYDRAIELAPHRAEFHDYRGIALARMGQLEDALQSLDRALALDPQNLNAMNNRANVLKLLKRPVEALAQIERVIERLPNFAAAHNNRGNALLELGRYRDAIASFDRALRLAPGQIDVLSNRATAFVKLRAGAEAIAAYREILRIDPNHRESLRNLGDLHANRREIHEAMACLAKAIQLDPNDTDSLILFAFIHSHLMDHKQAIVYYRRALALDRDNYDVLNNLAVALSKVGEADQALACHHRAIALRPDDPIGHYNLAWLFKEWRRYEDALVAIDRCLELDPRHPQALETRLSLAMALACWDKVESQREELRRMVATTTALVTPFPMLSVIDDPSAHRQCSERYVASRSYFTYGTFVAKPRREGRIRVGYLSADFYNHATLYLLMDTLEAHDRETFEFFAISFGPSADDPWRQRATKAFERFVDIQFASDPDAIRIVRDLELDIAVDLKGYTANLRSILLANRVAPVQANYLGFPGTMAMDTMDYLIGDAVVLPPESQRFYSEKIVYLPGCYQPNGRARAVSANTCRADFGLPEQAFVFCCFNTTHKVWPETFRVWMRLLSRVEGSVLWLWVDSETARRHLQDEAIRQGISGSRIICAAKAPRDEHLARLRHADLFLDTLPYNAHTTASDALRVGVPLLTCPGQSFAARVAASLLTALGLPELIASDMRQYEDIAVSLATDRDALFRVKAKLAASVATSTLFDPVHAARKLEAAFEAMHHRHQAGLPPEHLYL